MNSPQLNEPPLAIDGAAAHWDHRIDDDHYQQPGDLFRKMNTPSGKLCSTIRPARSGGRQSTSRSATSPTAPRQIRPMASALPRRLPASVRVFLEWSENRSRRVRRSRKLGVVLSFRRGLLLNALYNSPAISKANVDSTSHGSVGTSTPVGGASVRKPFWLRSAR